MSQAVALWGCKIEPGKRIPAHDNEDTAGSFRLTMAAIDSSDKSHKPSTVRVIRRPKFYDDNDDDDDDDIGGSSRISESDLKELEVEFVLCTLKHGEQYQQNLDLTFGEDEEIFFTTSGDCPVYLTGNYLISDLDDDYDISPDEDELFDKYSDNSDFNNSEYDKLDNNSLKIEELSSSESKASDSEKKRTLTDEDLDDLDNMIEDTNKQRDIKKMSLNSDNVDISKLSKKQRKKMKLNSEKNSHKEGKNKPSVSVKQNDLEFRNSQDSSKASVSFTKDIDVDSKTSKPKILEGGVIIEDKVIGKGPQVKDGSKVGLRYIGKLSNGKQFDCNTKGQPFSFYVGKGEVIKGWDIGIKGMALGGERRINVPSCMAYGKKALSGIPANSDLIFDVKLVKLS